MESQVVYLDDVLQPCIALSFLRASLNMLVETISALAGSTRDSWQATCRRPIRENAETRDNLRSACNLELLDC